MTTPARSPAVPTDGAHGWPLVHVVSDRIARTMRWLRSRGPHHAHRSAAVIAPTSAAGGDEAVVWGYRLFLGREPEDGAVVGETAERLATWDDVHDHFALSSEYAARHPVRMRTSMDGMEAPMDVRAVDRPDDLQRLFDHVAASWTGLGSIEPFYSVVTNEKFRTANVDEHLDEFWASGEADVRRLEATLHRVGVTVAPGATCLELGCGVGRLSAWLAEVFGTVIAVDISANHLELARRHLTERRIDNIELLQLCDLETLDSVAPFDVFFSLIVLQHNPPPVIERLLDRAFAKLSPGGVAVFQVPTYQAGYSFDIDRYIDGRDEPVGDGIEMHALPQRRIFELAADRGLRLVEVLEDGCTGLRPGEVSNTFVFVKP